jgi:chromosome partitioning protein
MDLVLDGVKKSKKRIAQLVDAFSGDYDAVVLDCPPSISLVSENVFKAADLVAVPLIPTVLSLQSFEHLRGYFESHELGCERLAPFFSMVDRRKTLHRETLKLAAEHPETFLEPMIPYLSVVEKMGLKRSPLAAFDKSSAATEGFRELTGEIAGRIGILR